MLWYNQFIDEVLPDFNLNMKINNLFIVGIDRSGTSLIQKPYMPSQYILPKIQFIRSLQLVIK